MDCWDGPSTRMKRNSNMINVQNMYLQQELQSITSKHVHVIISCIQCSGDGRNKKV